MPSLDPNNTFASLRAKILGQSGKQYWRSIEEHADTPEFREFVAQEYPHEIEEWDNSLSRRNFVKVMGASLALAGVGGCVIQPPEKIVPYVRPQEGMLPGKPNFFATSMSIGGVAAGLLAKSFEGRPIKVEGNPDHPGSRGATDILSQASILGMYDPDRSQEILFRGSQKSWAGFMAEVRASIDENRKDGGAGIRFLTETITSPTLIDQFTRLKAELPNAKWVQYEPVNSDNAFAGTKLAFGSPVQAIYKFDKAERILSLDADIFGGQNVAYMKDYALGRAFNEDKKDINRLYCVETTISLTGAKADHRLGIKPSEMVELAKAIAAAVGVSGATSTYTGNSSWISALAKDLVANKGKAVVVAGGNQSPVVHALAHSMNAALGAIGQTVSYIDPLTPGTEKLQIDQFRELISDVDAGAVKMLVILGGNPVYNSPADLKLNLERMNKVPLRIHLGLHHDETGEMCHWHIDEKFYLEGWSDARAYDGTASIVQPLINPLYDGKNAHELVQLFFKENFDKKDYDIVKEYWQKTDIKPAPAVVASVPKQDGPTTEAKPVSNTQPANDAKVASSFATANKSAPSKTAAISSAKPAATPAPAAASAPKNFEDHWRKAVHDGVIPGTASTPKPVTANTAFLSQPSSARSGGGPLEISILPDPCVFDGRFANNGWLQELPNPLNKVTWDNVALISPNTATRLGVNQGGDSREMAGAKQGTTFVNTKGGNLFSDLVKLKYQGEEIKGSVPMWITPGQPDDVITIYMGYGRTRAGKVGTGIGYNVFDVRRSDAMDHGFGEIVRSGETGTIASTQTHFNMEGRDLLRVWNLEEFEKNPSMGHQRNEYDMSMYPIDEHQAVYNKNHKWAMTVDLNSCVGCNACVLACQSENNIPVVGKEQVERHRAMHWMRIDAYYGGENINDPEGPHFQPVLCQQCEQAPCEVVCPVHATVHSAEGLNDMTYNRCVGTRYCSNNCPYKVRRFNFLLYQDWDTPQYKLMRNPEVTVRSRGVMEKCNYCTQRIANARIESEKAGVPIRDGEVVTACQSVCPTNAITFGDMHDASSAVAKTKKDHRNYNLLNELNTQPRTTYLAGLKNQNKEMPDYRATIMKVDAESDESAQPSGGEAH
ncbi:MAG: TAT-variant-translocated molybdopterin oxidoreductase [Acidobacteriota bacterium]